MDSYERSTLSDAFVEEVFKAGDVVIKSGEEGNKFYLVEEGELVATKVVHVAGGAHGQGHHPPGHHHEETKEVMHYH